MPSRRASLGAREVAEERRERGEERPEAAPSARPYTAGSRAHQLPHRGRSTGTSPGAAARRPRQVVQVRIYPSRPSTPRSSFVNLAAGERSGHLTLGDAVQQSAVCATSPPTSSDSVATSTWSPPTPHPPRPRGRRPIGRSCPGRSRSPGVSPVRNQPVAPTAASQFDFMHRATPHASTFTTSACSGRGQTTATRGRSAARPPNLAQHRASPGSRSLAIVTKAAATASWNAAPAPPRAPARRAATSHRRRQRHLRPPFVRDAVPREAPQRGDVERVRVEAGRELVVGAPLRAARGLGRRRDVVPSSISAGPAAPAAAGRLQVLAATAAGREDIGDGRRPRGGTAPRRRPEAGHGSFSAGRSFLT